MPDEKNTNLCSDKCRQFCMVKNIWVCPMARLPTRAQHMYMDIFGSQMNFRLYSRTDLQQVLNSQMSVVTVFLDVVVQPISIHQIAEVYI